MKQFLQSLFGERVTLTSGTYTTKNGTTVPFCTWEELHAARQRGVVSFQVDKAGVDLVGGSTYARRAL